ncbi:hypothetical protein F8163_17175 [Bacillus luti]|uniref:Uncharacterized protein n=1 Tax=Bacillus luti TaxID=2026191 RepID=A0A7V7S684_9BACI|nr:hypothetical protein [Bacillus luti]KAB2442007.1 hypothetical protein F8163_17175 [Bacillus luti]
MFLVGLVLNVSLMILSITSFVFLFIMYLCVNKYLDRQVVNINELLYIVVFGLLISMASTSILATRSK